MKKITLCLFFLVITVANAQSSQEIINNYLTNHYQKKGLSHSDVADWSIESELSTRSMKVSNVYVNQRHRGVKIFNAVNNFTLRDGKVLRSTDGFLKNISKKVNTTTAYISPTAAVQKALEYGGVVATISGTTSKQAERNKNTFKISGIEDPANVELVYQPTENDDLRLAYHVTYYTPGGDHLWSMRVDAVNGNLLEQNDLTVSCNFNHNHAEHSTTRKINFLSQAIAQPASFAAASASYRVLPFTTESPNHGAFELVQNPSDAVASPYGWHDTNGVDGAEHTTTSGNNVMAYEDRAGTNNIGLMPDGGPTLTFDFPYGGINTQPLSYQNAAITNLFYMNNIMHDVFYRYGFDEASGNFQSNNYGKFPADLTAGNDNVLAEAQDGSDFNNARFTSPDDGIPGRMQMYLWNAAPEFGRFTVNSPPSVAGTYNSNDNGFNPGNVKMTSATRITADLVLANPADACTALTNAAQMAGKIAVVRRGACDFTDKVKLSQDAGAIAVIIVNNRAGALTMSGANALITIPAIGISQADGEAIITKMATETVNATLKGSDFVASDGDFDNGIIAHEYGHGISIRLTGGRKNSSCLIASEQMGEGWSDFFALILTMKAGEDRLVGRGIGTFSSGAANTEKGIRQYKYATDMNVNPFTFGATNNMTALNAQGQTVVDVHSVGSVWCTMLYDLAWGYIDKYGFDPNIYTGNGGNNKVMQVVVDALKLQPCNPSFVQARDAIIQADQNTTGGRNFCLIWKVFARRGLGVNASSGTNATSGLAKINGIKDQIEDFTEPVAGVNCNLSVDYAENRELIQLYPNPTKDVLTISVGGYTGSLDIEILDLQGRIMQSESLDNFNASYTINTSSLQSGIYVVRLKGSTWATSDKVMID